MSERKLSGSIDVPVLVDVYDCRLGLIYSQLVTLPGLEFTGRWTWLGMFDEPDDEVWFVRLRCDASSIQDFLEEILDGAWETGPLLQLESPSQIHRLVEEELQQVVVNSGVLSWAHD